MINDIISVSQNIIKDRTEIMINRNDMLELTRRMTPSRTCFDRIAGAYTDECGEIDESFNIHFGKLSGWDKAKYLDIAKQIPFAKTNIQLKEYTFPITAKGNNSMYLLLNTVLDCGLKNDALMDILYEQIADGYPVDHAFAITVYHGIYDIPLKGKDHASQWDSEEVYDFIIGAISPLCGDYEPGDPCFGFLYPAFSDRSGDKNKIDIFHENPHNPEDGLLYKFLGHVPQE